jgi:uncharacterized membrane protein YdbT with pleckstrin-like domain
MYDMGNVITVIFFSARNEYIYNWEAICLLVYLPSKITKWILMKFSIWESDLIFTFSTVSHL